MMTLPPPPPLQMHGVPAAASGAGGVLVGPQNVDGGAGSSGGLPLLWGFTWFVFSVFFLG